MDSSADGAHPAIELNIDRTSSTHSGFTPHGAYKSRFERALVCNDATGPFNVELLQAFAKNSESFYTEVAARGPYVLLTTFHVSMMMSPETIAIVRALVQRLRVRGQAMVACAHVTGLDVEGREIMGDVYGDIYGQAGVPYSMFTDEAQARAWLFAQLNACASNGAAGGVLPPSH